MDQSDTTKRQLEAYILMSKIDRAISTLEVRRKSSVKEFGERIKRLRGAKQAMQQQEQIGTLAIEGLDAVSFDEEMTTLIFDPTRGL